MGDRQMGNYGLRRAAPKKVSQDFTYFGLKKEEPDAKKPKVMEETHIELLSMSELKKGRGRPRKTDPATVETKKIVHAETQDSAQEFILMDPAFPIEREVEEVDAAITNLEEGVEHAEEIIPFESVNEYVIDHNGESIQIMDFPIRIETVDAESKKAITEGGDYTESGTEIKIECGECHKVLKPSSYRQHLKTHLGNKPHACELCPARFTRRGDVERHVRIVHNKDKPYFCPKCPRSFGDKKNLRWHLMNHDKKLFHVCETCGFKFGKKDYYDNHVKYIHPLPTVENEADEEDGNLIRSDDEVSEQMLIEEETMVIRQAITLPEKNAAASGERNVMELTQKQLQSILEQSQSNRIAIVGQSSGVKFLTVTTKNAKKSSAQVVNMKALEKITNMSSQQIFNLHAPNETLTDPSELRAVVIEVDDMGEQPVEEIVIGGGVQEDDEADCETSDGANVDLIEALLDAAETANK